MKVQDILKGKMLEGSDDLRCGNCKHFSPRPGQRAGFCAIKVTSLYYDDWVCIRWERKPVEQAEKHDGGGNTARPLYPCKIEK